MTDHERSFLECIRDEPEADHHRLVYADWLEDHDRPEQADLIRVQIEIAQQKLDQPIFTLARCSDTFNAFSPPKHDKREPPVRYAEGVLPYTSLTLPFRFHSCLSRIRNNSGDEAVLRLTGNRSITHTHNTLNGFWFQFHDDPAEPNLTEAEIKLIQTGEEAIDRFFQSKGWPLPGSQPHTFVYHRGFLRKIVVSGDWLMEGVIRPHLWMVQEIFIASDFQVEKLTEATREWLQGKWVFLMRRVVSSMGYVYALDQLADLGCQGFAWPD